MPDPVALLRRHFGYPGFRPGQEELVRSVLEGRDALGILPTGGGKSVCYQVPALALEGLTLVVTPLVSLMEDQVGRAREVGLRAECLTAGQDAGTKRRIGQAAADGGLDLLFVAPERLETAGFGRLLGRLDVALLAVDEAHCISEWGHDFRPAYRRIGAVRARLGCPVLALTASATPRVREDVAASLGLRDPLVVVRSFDRPNLSWWVRPLRRGEDRRRLLGRLVRATPGTVLVYAPTRRAVEAARDDLAALGLGVEAYHAGLPAAERTRVQERFLSGDCQVVCATNAFGMGIDKADVRLVAHLQLPGTLEAYYQEAGRAGRDGEPAACVALRAPGDGRLGRRFVDRAHPPLRLLRGLHHLLGERVDGLGVARVGAGELGRDRRLGLDPDSVAAALAALERAGAVRVLEGPRDPDAARVPGTAPGPAAWRVGVRARPRWETARTLRRSALAKLAAVRRYGRTRGCRRRALLAWFGEEAPARCDGCDRCRPDAHPLPARTGRGSGRGRAGTRAAVY